MAGEDLERGLNFIRGCFDLKASEAEKQNQLIEYLTRKNLIRYHAASKRPSVTRSAIFGHDTQKVASYLLIVVRFSAFFVFLRDVYWGG